MVVYEDLIQGYGYRPRQKFMPWLLLCFLLVVAGICLYYLSSMEPIRGDLIIKSNGTEDLVNAFGLVGMIIGFVGVFLGTFLCLIIGKGRAAVLTCTLILFIPFMACAAFAIVYIVLVNGNSAANLELLSKMPWIGMTGYYGLAFAGSLYAVLLFVVAIAILSFTQKFDKIKTALNKMLACYEDKATRKKMKRRFMIDWKYKNYEHCLNDLYFPRVGQPDDKEIIEEDVLHYIIYKQKQDVSAIREKQIMLIYRARNYDKIRGLYYRNIAMNRAQFEYHLGKNSTLAKRARATKSVTPIVAKK
ncbi:MAG: hypothetical protein SPL02_02855 [Bacilli bacterium]|nr:hypothetical protein [Bacilli bacterium]MDY6430838.1 hypothetical protein [Bacilli bacterium]